MKIGRQTPKRRHNIQLDSRPSPTEAEVERPRMKKALLVGINNTLMTNSAGKKGTLKMPHEDVSAMRSLLIENYGYNPADIVTLIDIDDPKQPQPTQARLLEEMNNLVADAKRGDRFFFHYCGHVVQKPNKDRTEEDGMDECIVPCDSDGDRNIIMDDTLRQILVDQLPLGCHLIAIFDSCHSASLLDLEHFRCNRVYVPWMSKGRRKSESMWNNIRRQPALISSRTIYQAQRIGDDRVKRRRTNFKELSPVEPSENTIPSSPLRTGTLVSDGSPSQEPFTNISPTSTSTSAKAAKILAKLDPRGGGAGAAATSLSNSTNQNRKPPQIRTRSLKTVKSQFSPWLEGNKIGEVEDGEATSQLCESPVQEFCTGWCRHTGPETPPSPPTSTTLSKRQSSFGFMTGYRKEAEVISLASAKDSQRAWESDGSSMTQVLVKILKNEPHPTLKDLMLDISHKLHDKSLAMHGNTKQYKRDVTNWRKNHPQKARARSESGDTSGLNLNNFQDPQLSSRKPLDMNSRWHM